MREWLIEQGIGEERAILLENDQVKAAQLYWPAQSAPGQIFAGKLVKKIQGAARGTVQAADGTSALIDKLPVSVSEGATIHCEVTRMSITERGRTKLAQVRYTEQPLRAPDNLADQLQGSGDPVKIVRRFPDGLWEDVWFEAWSGEVPFPGGSLILYHTPAMTLIDVDGAMAARELSLAAAKAITTSIKRLDIAGSIGIDFPTLEKKTDRKAVDAMLQEGLTDYPHERTAMNGFGFVQIISRKSRMSLLELLQHNPFAAAARMLLRKAEGLSGSGALSLRAHPMVLEQITTEWQNELGRRTACQIRLEPDDALAIEAGHAQIVPL